MSEETTPKPPVAAAAPAAATGEGQVRRPERSDRPGGDRGGDRGGPRGPRGDRPQRPRRRFPRRKVCYFRQIKADYVDFKDVDTLKRFVTERGKIVPRRVTGTSAKYQRLLCTAIKRARFMALLPYTGTHK